MSVTTVRGVSQYPVQSPLWWVDRLYARLMARRPVINRFDDYYRGNFPLPWLAPQAASEFRRVLKMSRSGYLGLVVDAMCERMAVEGFRLNVDVGADNPSDKPSSSTGKPGDKSGADRDLWDIWQFNDLDTYFDQGLLEAAITGQSYLLVAPNVKKPNRPHIWVEHSAQMIVEFVPGSNRRERAAALKLWVDDWTGRTQATLYLPDAVYKFSSTSDQFTRPIPEINAGVAVAELLAPTWGLREVPGEEPQAKNPIGQVPVFELPNNPRLLTGGQSEMYDLLDTQDRIVKTLADRLITQDFGAFPQKWISGWPEEDAAGNANPEIEVGRDRILKTEVVETKFGQFAAADLLGYLDAKRADVVDIASRSRTPAQYLLSEMANVNGDTLKASESGLVAKVRQRQRGHNDPVEQAMRMTRDLAGLAKDGDDGMGMEVIWKNPEFRTEGELTDALLKMSDLGVPEEALWERWGATPQEVERWQAMLEDKMKRAAAGDATVVLADRFRQMAAGQDPQGGATNANGGGGLQGGGGANRNGTQPGQPRGTKGPGNRSGGTSSANASQRRPNAPRPSTT